MREQLALPIGTGYRHVGDGGGMSTVMEGSGDMGVPGQLDNRNANPRTLGQG
jgi:hypothetical protein